MADYTKTEWLSGDIVTADKLNKIESGIADNADDIAANKAELDNQAAKDVEHETELASQAAKDVEHDTAIAAINLKLLNNDATIMELQNTDKALQEAIDALDTSSGDHLTALDNSVAELQTWVEKAEALAETHFDENTAKFAELDATDTSLDERVTAAEATIAENSSSIEALEAVDSTTNSEIELIKATLTATANSVSNIQNWVENHQTTSDTKFDELDATDAEIKSTMVTGINYVEGTGVLTLLGVDNTEIATVTISTAGTVLKAAELADGGKLQLTWQLVDGSTTPMEIDLSDLIDIYTAGTGITVENNEISINTTWADARYPVVSITSDNGRAFIQNEVTGGGAYYQHTDGTNSFVGVNDGGADGITGQIYSIDSSTKYGTRLNLFKNGFFYHPNKTSSDVNYVINDPNQELAVKGDVEAVRAEIPDMTGYATLDAMTSAITTATTSTVEAMNSAIAIATEDCATTKMLMDELAKIEEAHDAFATAEALSTLEASLPSTYCVATVTSDTGTALIQNEETGGGPKYWHVDGTRSYTGVNNGGADGIGVQTYVINNDTKVGTRINVFAKGAFYITNKANTDADYVADDAQFEIAVKGDLTELQTTIEEKIPSIEGLATTEAVDAVEAKIPSIDGLATTEALEALKAEYEAIIAALAARIDALEAAADTSSEPETGEPEGDPEGDQETGD